MSLFLTVIDKAPNTWLVLGDDLLVLGEGEENSQYGADVLAAELGRFVDEVMRFCNATKRHGLGLLLFQLYHVSMISQFSVSSPTVSATEQFCPVVRSILPGLSFAGVFWIFGALILEEEDEFYRLLYVRQGLIATGVSFTLAAVWGFLETYEQVEAVAAFWWPTLWCVGIGIGAIANKVKYGTYGEIR